MKNTAKLSIVLWGVILLFGIISAAQAAIVAESARLNISLISQGPDPAEPGQLLDIRFKIDNLGGSGTKNIIFEILPEYPFSIYSGEAVRNLGSMQAYQHGEEGIIAHYKLRVDENAIEGTNYIDVRYKFDDLVSSWVYVRDFPIRIRTEDVILLIDEITSIPDIIPPGEIAELRLKIKNFADSLIKNINIKIDLSADATPFVPIGSTTEKKIYQINSKEEAELIFSIMAKPDASAGAYKIPLNMSYSDESGTSYIKRDLMGLIIGSKPDLYVGIDKSEVYSAKKAGKVTIKLVNKGLSDIKLLNIQLKESEDYKIISPAEVYVGNIDSDDYETAEFTIYVTGKGKTIALPLMINYMDANNKRYSPIKNIELFLYSSSEAKAYGLSKESSIGSVIILLIVAGGLAVYFWKRKKNGKSLLFWKKKQG